MSDKVNNALRSVKIQEIVRSALRSYMNNSARSVQASEGRLGPSDIGFCRQKAALMTRGVPQTDEVSKWAAGVGTAIHNYVEAALKESHPTWLLGSIDNITVTAALPSGAQITGHPDIVVLESNAVLDIKTVDGFEWVRREGTSIQHKYQRHLYALGLIQAGILDEDKPVLVGNIYLDRSGKNSDPLVLVEEMDYSLTPEIDSWVQDVIYAVSSGEDASRDIPAAVCERICTHFTACRGQLEDHDGGEFITDKDLLSAIDMYVEGRDMKKRGDAMQKAAQEILANVNGITENHQVRWVDVQTGNTGYRRMDIRKIRK